MMAGVHAYTRVRNLAQSLAILRADSFGHAASRKARQAKSRLSLYRQVHATTTRRSHSHPNRSKHDKVSATFFNSSISVNYGSTLDPGEKTESAADEETSKISPRPYNPEEKSGDEPKILKSKPKLRSKWESPWRGHSNEKFYALGSWASLKHDDGWRLAWATTPWDENARTGTTWCDMHLERLNTEEDPLGKERWTASVQAPSPLEAKERALEVLFSETTKDIDWYDMSGESDEIKFLQMVLTNRLTLETKSKGLHWSIFVKVPGSIIPFKTTLPQLIPMMQAEGVWSRLLGNTPEDSISDPVQVLESESSEHKSAFEPLSQSTPSPTKELDPDAVELLSPGRTEQEPPMVIERAVQTLLDSNEKSRNMFRRLMAIGRLDMSVKVLYTGEKICRASYNERDARVDAIIKADPFEPILRSDLERRATRVLVAKLWAYKLLGNEIQSSAVWPDCKLFLNDEIIWGLRSTRDQLLDADRSVLPEPQDSLSEWPESHMSKELITYDTQAHSKRLSMLLKRRRESKYPKVVAIQSVRAKLPVFQIGNQILELINKNTYTIISAETGTGKSTQVPQIILDDAIDRGVGAECRIICVQPRRIASQLLAQRVAEERNQLIGSTVGSVVRFDRREPDARGGTITYCTTGIMLNYLQYRPKKLDSLTHIILDEVHVRDLGIDFTMLLLKRYVDRCRTAGIREPRIVIMSATVDIDLFTSYFQNIGPDGALIPAPHICLPGRHHHVKKHYLAEILDTLRKTTDFELLSLLLSDLETKQFLVKHHELFGDSKYTPVATSGSSPSRLESQKQMKLEDNPDEFVPCGLVSALVFHILSTTESGSILVFLPGLAWIETLAEQLNHFASSPNVDLDFSDDNKFRILQLHADRPEEMEKLSLPVPEGCRRILLSTDIAEASVTLPDVKYVIDSGKANLIKYNSETRARHLECSWVGRSNAIQRQGRAGRVQDGEYFFLGMQKCYDNLRPTRFSEIQREDLRDVCMRAKDIAPDVPLRELLQQTIEPPDHERVDNAIEALKLMKAIDENENKTSLGVLISRTRLSPTVGKLAILGVIFRCLDPLLIIAAVERGKSIFPTGTTTEERKNIQKIRSSFAGTTSSDHIAELNAFRALREKWGQGRQEAQAYATSENLNLRGYNENFETVCAIYDTLAREHLLPRERGFPQNRQFGRPYVNINSHNIPLIKALVAHTLSAQISAPKPFNKFDYYSATESALAIRLVSTVRDKENLPQRQLIAHSSKHDSTMNSVTTLANVSSITPLTACLMGGRLVWKDQQLRMNDWLAIPTIIEKGAFSRDEALRSLFELRKAIDRSLTTAYESLIITSVDSLEEDHDCSQLIQSRREFLRTLGKTVSAIFEQDNSSPDRHAQPTKWDTHRLESLSELSAEAGEQEQEQEAKEVAQ
ncbi:hypothetical protein N7478_009111 [Penicillium angulare]|uniref:uncharacterized protein n=1 Tax=Penicillium angulare TaxID=116970 RepID=UPI0025401940|nr:uncharacterized protein N7478_009111 [Penicillium angulare]KAJ5273986.1 hypothetical protein N7478_009111 [Penicillium angulare]